MTKYAAGGENKICPLVTLQAGCDFIPAQTYRIKYKEIEK